MDELEKIRAEIDETDKELSALFCKRMALAARVAEYKKGSGMPICDAKRESAILEKGDAEVPPELRALHRRFRRELMTLSKMRQAELLADDGVVPVFHEKGVCPVVIKAGAIARVGQYFDLDRRVLIVCDEHTAVYADTVRTQCKDARAVILPAGEKTKSEDALSGLLKTMLAEGFTRQDAIIALGGGVICDLCGLAASLYMRGIDLCSVPTSLLAMVDASVGAKNAINAESVKNPFGTFYPPKAVVCDPDVLKTLPHRHLMNGFWESAKMGATLDAALFDLVFDDQREDHIEEIIRRSVTAKAEIVELDEYESGLRRVLNFGHTLGHAIESCARGALYHGECVAYGMLAFSSGKAKDAIRSLALKLALPPLPSLDPGALTDAFRHDKKRVGGAVNVVRTDEIGTYQIVPIPEETVIAMIREEAFL